MKIKALLILVLFLVSLTTTPWIRSYFKIDSLEDPKTKEYRGDEMGFLKNYYLMEKGENYYSAFKFSRENFSTGSLLQSDVLTWRLPTVFYMWNFFANNGQQILQLFIFLTLTFLLSLYLIFKRVIGNFAILSPIIVIPYLIDTIAYKTAFLFTEWWGFFFFIFGLCAFFYNKKILAFVFFVLAVTTRELFIVPLVFMTIYGFVKKEDRKLFTLILISFSVFYLFHWINVQNLIDSNSNGLTLFERFKNYNLDNLRSMISFSMRGYVIGGWKSHYIFIILGFCGILTTLIFNRTKETIYIAISVISMLISFPIIAVLDNDYWGITFVPLILASIPLIFNLKVKYENRFFK